MSLGLKLFVLLDDLTSRFDHKVVMISLFFLFGESLQEHEKQVDYHWDVIDKWPSGEHNSFLCSRPRLRGRRLDLNIFIN